MDPNTKLQQGALLVTATGIMLIGYGLTFLYVPFFGTGFELGVSTLGDVTRADLAASNPALLQYVDHLHIGLGGLLAALGVGIAAFAWYGIRDGHRWALAATFAIALIALATNFAVHFDPGFGYDWLIHVAPSVVVTLLVFGGIAWAHRGLQTVERQRT